MSNEQTPLGEFARAIEKAPKVADAPFSLTHEVAPRDDGKQIDLFSGQVAERQELSWIERALRYAAERWLWIDDPLIREMAAWPDSEGETPEEFIDRMAEKYDLLDPRDP